jgi:predicted porin
MKKALISAAAVAALGFAGAAQAETAVYGLFDFGVKQAIEKDADALIGGNGNSTTRFGVKSSLDVGDGVKANFKYEAGFNASHGAQVTDTDDDGVGDDLGLNFNRQAWAGLSGSFGEIRYGVQDNVAFDHFIGYDYNGWSNTASSAALAGTDLWGQSSQGNVLKYIAPAMGDLSASISLIQADPDADGAFGEQTEDIISVGATYATGPISISAAFATAGTKNQGKLTDEDYMGAAFQYDFGAFKANIGYHTRGDLATGIQFGAVTDINGVSVGFGYGTETESEGTAYEIFASKEIYKGVYAYGEFGSADKKTKAGNGDDVTGYAVGLILTF